MKAILAFRPVLLTGLLTAAVLGAIRWAVEEGRAELLVPSPEATARQFVGALKARRYEAAYHLLDERARTRTSPGALRLWMERTEVQGEGLSEIGGLASRTELSTARVAAFLKGKNGREYPVEFGFQKERGLWKIRSAPGI